MKKLSLRDRFLRALVRNGSVAFARRRIIREFAEKHDFVYFGTVDKLIDDAKVVRGFSSTITHRDDNYTVGSLNGYDVRLVDRLDMIELPGGSTEKHQWLIIEVDIHSDQPTMFFIPSHHAAIHYRKIFTHLRALEQVNLKRYSWNSDELSDRFSSRYKLYAKADIHGELEDALRPNILDSIAQHLWPSAIEVSGGFMYLYYVESTLTAETLSWLIKNSTWLAQALDDQKIN